MFLGRPWRKRRAAGKKGPLPLQAVRTPSQERSHSSQLMACGPRGWMPPNFGGHERENAWSSSVVLSHDAFCGCDDPVTHLTTLLSGRQVSRQSTPSAPPPRPPPPSPRQGQGSGPPQGRIRPSWSLPVAPPSEGPWPPGGGAAGGDGAGGDGAASLAAAAGDGGDGGPGGVDGGGRGDADVADLLAALEGDVDAEG